MMPHRQWIWVWLGGLRRSFVSDSIVQMARSVEEQIARQRNQPWYLDLQNHLEQQQLRTQQIHASLELPSTILASAEISRIQDSIRHFRDSWKPEGTIWEKQQNYQAILDHSANSAILQNVELARRQLENVSLLKKFIPSAVELESTFQSFSIPAKSWLNSQGAQELLLMTEMVSRAIAKNPYSDSATAILRAQLGDFRVYEETFAESNPKTRQKLREKAGADPNISQVDEASIEIILDATGIKLPEPPDFLPLPAEVENFAIQSGNDLFHHNWLKYIEDKFRRLVESVLKDSVGKKWIKQRVQEEIRNRWQERKLTSEKAKNFQSQLSLIYYSDFNDCLEIIIKKDNWPLFESIFIRKESLQESFYRILPIRHDLSHSRPLSKEDGYYFHCEVHRLYRLITEWETNGKVAKPGNIARERKIRWRRKDIRLSQR